MKVGLVLEGGAMRGMYTAGVIDMFLEKKYKNRWNNRSISRSLIWNKLLF